MSEGEKKEAAKDAKEAPKEGAPEAAAPPATGIKKLLPFLVGGVASIGLGLGAAIVTQEKQVEAVKSEPKKEAEPTPYDTFTEPKQVKLASVVVNLADSGTPAAVRLTVALEVRCKNKHVEEEELPKVLGKDGSAVPKIRDALLILLSNKQASDVRTARGKELLKLEILDRLKPIVFEKPEEGVLTGIYLDECVVQ